MRAALLKDQARDLEADLALCELALEDKGAAIGFMVQAPEGWPYAIRRAIEAEEKIDSLQNELQIYKERERGRGCWD